MIIWLASYPKSGNTLVRSMLSSYFFSNDGLFNFDLIKNIRQFPSRQVFQKYDFDFNDAKETIKNYINIQDKINIKNSVQFVKTHSYLFNINNYAFTNLKNSLGVIYIIRDPRNVVTSWANHYSCSIEESCDYLINQTQTIEDEKQITIFHGTWKSNYQSWKSFKFQERYLLIKYEDLILDRKSTFLKILKFIFKLNKTKFSVNPIKLDNMLKSTTFKKMKDLEKNKGFPEAVEHRATKEKITFFNQGPDNDWKKKLDKKIIDKLEKAFKFEMEELNYL
jgi:hypothetical protein